MAVTVLQSIQIFKSEAILLTIVREGVEFEVILVDLLVLPHAACHHFKNVLIFIGTELVVSQSQLLKVLGNGSSFEHFHHSHVAQLIS